MMHSIFKWLLFRVWGWKIKGQLPPLRKYILAVAPHTSWKDFPLAIMLRSALKLKAGYIGKDSLFKGPFGWFFRMTGGYPVNRSERNNFVDSVVAMIHSREDCIIGIAPEGTRKRVDQFRTGFYYMALRAGVPIVMTRLDAANRMVQFSEPFYPSGDFEKDIEVITAYFRGVEGFVPGKGVYF